ncbi:hypothetical protein PMAYCL1PPCAC_13990, partial [Pristionchus mayeri]
KISKSESVESDESGFLLRCDCGHESFSYHHTYQCEISNFTVVRGGGVPIQKCTSVVDTNLPNTPQCVLC